MQIIKGEDRTLTLYLVDENGEPRNLTGATEITIKIPNASGSTINKTLTGGAVANVGGGVVTVSITDSDDLKVALDQSLEAIVDVNTTRRVYRVVEKLDVLAQLY